MKYKVLLDVGPGEGQHDPTYIPFLTNPGPFGNISQIPDSI